MIKITARRAEPFLFLSRYRCISFLAPISSFSPNGDTPSRRQTHLLVPLCPALPRLRAEITRPRRGRHVLPCYSRPGLLPTRRILASPPGSPPLSSTHIQFAGDPYRNAATSESPPRFPSSNRRPSGATLARGQEAG